MALDFRGLLDIAARTMSTGMVIGEAPSGRVLFKNQETDRIFGEASAHVERVAEFDGSVAFKPQGGNLASDQWPVSRAMRGETVVGEHIEIQRRDGTRRIVSISASPVRDDAGEIVAAVATYVDVTETRRAHDAACYLAEAGALLERFDPETSLQRIVDLAVPMLADWCFIHLNTDGPPAIVAIAHADTARVASARARAAVPQPLSADTAVARVLAGGPREIVNVDDATLEEAARDPSHLGQLRERGYRSAVVAPLVGRDRVLGAVTFVMAESGRRYQAADLDMLTELARRTGIALQNARLFAAEQQARRHAEEARDRTRHLQQLTDALSTAVEKDQVLSIMVDAARAALGAGAGFAWLLRDDQTLQLAATENPGNLGFLKEFMTIPKTARLPVWDVIETGQPLTFESLAALREVYPEAPDQTLYKSWAVIPFVVGGRGVGTVSFSFEHDRKFSEEDRALLMAMSGQASLAFARCMLLDAERRARTEAEAARARERQLHELAARLSSALTPEQVASAACEEAVSVLGALSAVIAVPSDDSRGALRILGIGGNVLPPGNRPLRVPIDAVMPVAEAIRRSEMVWCSGEAELAARYSQCEDAWRKRSVRAWGAIPFRFEGCIVGSIACLSPRSMS